MIDTPRIVDTQDQPYAFIHLNSPRTEMHAVLPPTLNELFAAVEAQGLSMVPWFAHHLTPATATSTSKPAFPLRLPSSPPVVCSVVSGPPAPLPARSTTATTQVFRLPGTSSTSGSGSTTTPTPGTSTSTTSSTRAPPRTRPSSAPNSAGPYLPCPPKASVHDCHQHPYLHRRPARYL